jgi:uncharacterized protein (DUF433 family)
MKYIIHTDPDILGGVPVFYGTRVPVSVLFDYLQEGELNDFLEGYPHISRAMVNDVLALVAKKYSRKSKKVHYESIA